MVSAADVVDIIREQLGLLDVAPTSDASSSESVGCDNRHQDQRSTSASNTDTDDNEKEDEDKDSAWLENYRNEDGLLINDEGRIRIHEPFSHDGAKGFRVCKADNDGRHALKAAAPSPPMSFQLRCRVCKADNDGRHALKAFAPSPPMLLSLRSRVCKADSDIVFSKYFVTYLLR